MKMLGKILAAHPLDCSPYDKLKFVRLNGRVPLYSVDGCGDRASRAYDALGRAFSKYGGNCFYCSDAMAPQRLLASGPHRDHVIPRSKQKNDLLHNLVIACGNCGRGKGSSSIELFRPDAAGRYLEALHRHLSLCVKRDFGARLNPSSPPPPKRA
jgi:hypothetical protein